MSLHDLHTSEIENERTPSVFRDFLASVMAVYLSITKKRPEMPVAEQFANSVRHRLTVLTPTDLMTVQTLLVISMYEWGTGNRQQAWMTSGMAIRMMQFLQAVQASASHSQAELQMYNRTSWSCFIMDRLILSGIPQPATLSHTSLNTFWPSSEEDFIFGQPPNGPNRIESGQNILEHMRGDMANYYSTLVRGFDIWMRILKWVISGGRRLPGMNLPENHPWTSTSPWALLYGELQTWRELQEKRMLYPDASIASHAALGQAEPFAYLNLIYFVRYVRLLAIATVEYSLSHHAVSLLFLDRAYLPFLPTTCDKPSGPIDPPLLPSDAPIGWWRDRANELFVSAASISIIMGDLDDADVSLYTPFPGFCLFSAVTTNLYALAFPWMDPEENQKGSLLIEKDLCWLDRFRTIWRIGEGWWLTSQHCKRLYEHASADLDRYRGRSRADFDVLESSIHDCQGRPSRHDEVALHNEGVTLPDHGTSAHINEQGRWETQDARDISDVLMQTDLGWSQLWPLWGQQYDGPFAAGGLPLGID
jgi:hypothetical protein